MSTEHVAFETAATAERRMRWLWSLGGIATRLRTSRRVSVSPRPEPRWFLLPEIDPVTRRATGNRKQWREVTP